MARPNASRAKILDAAAALAAAQGVSQTTVDDIAAKAGVAKGSVYYNFESKEALFEALLAEAISTAIERITQVRSTAQRDVVAAVAAAFITGVSERPERAKVVLTELLRTDRPWSDAVADYRAAMLEQVRLAVAADGGAPTMLRASAVFGSIVMVAFERVAFEPDMSIERCVEAVLG